MKNHPTNVITSYHNEEAKTASSHKDQFALRLESKVINEASIEE